MSDMSDKQTPKTFNEFLKNDSLTDEQVNELKNLSDYDFAVTFGKYAWNAATEVTRTEYEDKIKAMQAEIDNLRRGLNEYGDDDNWDIDFGITRFIGKYDPRVVATKALSGDALPLTGKGERLKTQRELLKMFNRCFVCNKELNQRGEDE